MSECEESQGEIKAFIGSTDYHYLQKDYKKIKNLVQNSWHDIAWKNDELHSEIIVITLEDDVFDLNVEITDFRNENNNLFPKTNISVRYLRETLAYKGRGLDKNKIPNDNKEPIMDVIYKGLPINIKANRVQPLWVDIKVPKDTKPGRYTGKIMLKISKNYEYYFDYSFEVLDIRLSAPGNNSNFSLELWQYPYTVARYYEIDNQKLFHQEHLDILKNNLNLYKSAGGNSITVTIVEDCWNGQTTDKYPSMVKWTKNKNGEFTFDYEKMDTYVNLALSLGINKQIKSFSMLPWEDRIIYFDENKGKKITSYPSPGSTEWQDIWNQFLKSYINHLDEKGWFDITYISMDERPVDQMKAVIKLVKSHRNQFGKTLKISSAIDFDIKDKKIFDSIDDISISLSNIQHGENTIEELAKHRRNLGFTTTMYTMVHQYPNSFTRSQPGESAWTIWYAESQKLDGFLRWAFDAWVDDPLNDATHFYFETGDVALIYPVERGSFITKPYNTPRFKKMAEGIRDINKLRYLKTLDSKLKTELTELTKTMKRFDGRTNEFGAKVANSEKTSKIIATEATRLRKELNRITKKYLEENKR